MDSTKEAIYKKIKEEIKLTDPDFSLDKLTHGQIHRQIHGFLKTIVENLGCYDYHFVLAITDLEGKYGRISMPYLFEILDNYCVFPDVFDERVAFAAFYNLGVHFARSFAVQSMYDLLVNNDYYERFYRKFPLCYEIASRYFGLKGMFSRQYLMCKCAIKQLKRLKLTDPRLFETTPMGYEQTGDNVALKVGCVSAICSLLERRFIRGNLAGSLRTADGTHFEFDEVDQAELCRKLRDDTTIEDPLDDSIIGETHEFVDQAIEYNGKYPKYPYLKARIIFYAAIVRGESITRELSDTLHTMINRAKSLENRGASDYDVRCSQYDRFIAQVETYRETDVAQDQNQKLQYLEMKNEIMYMKECPAPQNRPDVTAIGDESYVFVSYSSKDFKSVYCDLLELRRRNICYWYDKDVIPSEKWQTGIEERIKNASCVLCFLSANFLRSPAVLVELSLLKKYNKRIIWIDLTGNKQISKIIIDVIRTADKETLSGINSEMLNVLTGLLHDDIDLIVRENDPLAVLHVDRIESVLALKCPETIQRFDCESHLVKNTKTALRDGVLLHLPNEDYILKDPVYRIYIVMDGITRPKHQYVNEKDSIAYDVSKLFADTVHQSLQTSISSCRSLFEAKEILREAFTVGNRAVGQMLDERRAEHVGTELPGAVGIVAFLYNNQLCFGSVGDCMGILVRNGTQIVFSQKQTTFAFDMLHHETDRELLAREFINKKSPYAYGVVNGQEGAVDCFKISHIDLDRGDVVYLVSDGVSDYIQYADPAEYNALSLKEIVKNSAKQDALMKKPYNDDKSIVRIYYK